MPDIKMVNMKIDPKKVEEAKKTDSVAAPQPTYPWGLGLHLDDESLAKLGLNKMPGVGKSVIVVGRADVSSLSENEFTDEDGHKKTRRSLALQITDLGIGENEPEQKPDAQDVLYKES